MSLNTAHASNGVLIHSGEYILLFSDNVSMEFSGQDSSVFKGTKIGRIYLTSHRMIFNAKLQSETLQSFSFPFIALNDVELEQPVFGANYIKGKVRAQPNGNWTGEVKFKLHFKSGGAIDFGQALLRAAGTAQRNMHSDGPPPYTPPTGSWYEAPQPAYQPPPGYYGWLPQNDAFSQGPPPNTVYMSDNPPPYPGIGTPQTGGAPGYNNGYPGGFAQPQGNFPGAPPQQGYPGAPPQHGYPGAPPQHGYPGAPPQQGYPGSPSHQGYPGGPPQHGYPAVPGQQGYPEPQPPQAGFTGSPTHGYPGTPAQGYPATSPQSYPGAPQQGYPSAPPSAGFVNPYPGSAPTQNFGGGYPNTSNPSPGAPAGTMGFTAGPANTKEDEANRSGAYFDPRQQQAQQNHGGYAPPPSFYAPPPSYNSLNQNQKQ